jgi:hypothetical protein
MNPLRDQRGIVADWLVKLLIGFTVVAIVGYDAGSIAVNYFTLSSGSDDVAIALSTEIATNRAHNWTDDEIFDLAKTYVASPDGPDGAKVLRDGTEIDDQGVVHIALRRTASTLIVSRIGAIKDWAVATVKSTAGT